MRLERIARHALLLFLALLLPLSASAATDYYVDFARSTNGNGSAASPWKNRSDINWTIVKNALASGTVTIYFSSRATWSNNEELKVPSNTNTTTNRLTFDGKSRYNLATTGTAVWNSESSGSKAVLTNAGGTGGNITVLDNRNQFITIRGFHLKTPTWSGINLGEANPTLNIHDILIEDNYIDSPVNNHGVWFGYAEAGCYNVTVRGNTIIASVLESIYMGHYNYLPDTITGTVIEYNTIIDSGKAGEGDIDIKAGNFGAIVRYNTMHATGTGKVLAGIVIQASNVQAYGNELYNLASSHGTTDGGNGIQINADGDGLGHGKTLNNLLIYNNSIHGNAQAGISMYTTANGARITNAKIMNNTLVGNGSLGAYAAFHTSSDSIHSIEIARFENNIISSGSDYAMNIASGTSFTVLDYNAYFGTSNLLRYEGIVRTFAEWRTLGFDAQGLNANPNLDAKYAPLPASPVIGTGATLTEFTIDKNEATRVGPWDMGAFNRVSTPPQDLRIVP